jgi:hypothetical protein
MARTSIDIATSADPAAAAQRVAWAERRRTTAVTEARQAHERLAVAEEQLREARQALRSARALAAHDTTAEMIGMGFFADELAFERAA